MAPLPTPNDGESHDDFMDRCMADETMNEEHPAAPDRRAVCESQWDEAQEGAQASAYPRVTHAFYSTPWAIMPEKLAEMRSLLNLRASGQRLDIEDIRARIGARSAQPDGRGDQPGAIAVIPVHGVLAQRMDLFGEISGGTSTERVQRRVRAAAADSTVGAIVLDVDSPGGNVYGIQELADEIRAAAERKKVVAVANSLAASAAYWISATADEFVVTPGGEVGSIGVIAAHEDHSDFVGKPEAGVRGLPRVEFITAGEFKDEGHPFGPLSEDARAFVQQRVDEYYDAFVQSVATDRGTTVEDVKENFGKGRVFGASQARQVGMVDGIETLDAVIERLASSSEEQRKRPTQGKRSRRMEIAQRE